MNQAIKLISRLSQEDVDKAQIICVHFYNNMNLLRNNIIILKDQTPFQNKIYCICTVEPSV